MVYVGCSDIIFFSSFGRNIRSMIAKASFPLILIIPMPALVMAVAAAAIVS
jgi:hypothetical protein